jgi:hypothetical protein
MSINLTTRPDEDKLAKLYMYFGHDYNDRVLPSIGNEVIKSILAKHLHSQILNEKDTFKLKVREELKNNLQLFHIILEDIDIQYK